MKNITVSGDLGSGKSTVSKAVAAKLDLNYMSTGNIQREIAREMNLTTLELNLLAEKETQIDDKIDGYTKDLAHKEEEYIVDSRMAWHFLPNSLKVFLVADENVAVQRVQIDKQRSQEGKFTNEEELKGLLAERRISERRRFLQKYKVDYRNLDNYDLIIDASYLDVESISDIIVERYKDNSSNHCYISPKQLIPTQSVRALIGEEYDALISRMAEQGFDHEQPVYFIDYEGKFLIFDGHKRVSAAIRSDLPAIPCIRISSTQNQEIQKGLEIDQFVEDHLNISWIYDWEAVHEFSYSSYPDFTEAAEQ